jgi:hypothetical protein
VKWADYDNFCLSFYNSLRVDVALSYDARVLLRFVDGKPLRPASSVSLSYSSNICPALYCGVIILSHSFFFFLFSGGTNRTVMFSLKQEKSFLSFLTAQLQ